MVGWCGWLVVAGFVFGATDDDDDEARSGAVEDGVGLSFGELLSGELFAGSTVTSVGAGWPARLLRVARSFGPANAWTPSAAVRSTTAIEVAAPRRRSEDGSRVTEAPKGGLYGRSPSGAY